MDSNSKVHTIHLLWGCNFHIFHGRVGSVKNCDLYPNFALYKSRIKDTNKICLLGFLSCTPSHVPSANSVAPMYFTIPISPLTNTLIPSSSTGLGERARERGVGEEE